MIGESRGDVEAQAVDLEVQGVAPFDDRLSGAGRVAGALPGLAAFAGAVQPPARAVRPGRIQLVVRGPGRVPGVPVAEAALEAQEADPGQVHGPLEGTIGRRLRSPGERLELHDLGLGLPVGPLKGEHQDHEAPDHDGALPDVHRRSSFNGSCGEGTYPLSIRLMKPSKAPQW
ncbi:MAG: hypothetical protein MZV63_13685 [Marinilabiliales bacterium]|nr:hypothetical protein [Marinilabiliales bacterium]